MILRRYRNGELGTIIAREFRISMYKLKKIVSRNGIQKQNSSYVTKTVLMNVDNNHKLMFTDSVDHKNIIHNKKLALNGAKDETWIPVPGYEGFYSISNFGNVKSERRKSGSYPGRQLKERVNKDGYIKFVLYKDSIRSTVFAHRIVYTSFHGEIPANYEIDHLNGLKNDNRLCNLEAVSKLENMRRSFKNPSRTINRGSRNGLSRLNEDIVFDIKKRLSSGIKQINIASELGLSKSIINKIAKGKTWIHVALPD